MIENINLLDYLLEAGIVVVSEASHESCYAIRNAHHDEAVKNMNMLLFPLFYVQIHGK